MPLLHWYPLALVVKIAVEVTLSIAMAALSWHLFESHFLRLKRFFEYRRPSLPGLVADPQ
jgi:peptidoglycan/LPS O-acetylase OafA/YrhL